MPMHSLCLTTMPTNYATMPKFTLLVNFCFSQD